MAFTEYLFDKDAILASLQEKKANLKANQGRSNFVGFAIGVIQRRLVKDPARYRDYGPYWWAVKDVLVNSGIELGQDDDEAVRRAYSGDTDAETIVMADTFRSLYLETYFVGTNQLTLDGESGEVWTLWDEDMETAIAATASL